MNVITKKKASMVAVLLLALIFSIIYAGLSSANTYAATGDSYLAWQETYTDGGDSTRSLWIKKSGTNDKEVAYCMDPSGTYPVTLSNGGTAYKEAGVNTNAQVRLIMYNGYPLDGAGLIEKLGLSKAKALKLTQNAIWGQYGGNILSRGWFGLGGLNSDEEQYYYELLMGTKTSVTYKGETLKLATPPADMVVTIYSYGSTYYQKLISVYGGLEPETPELTPVKLSKTDIAGEELSGATVEVQKANGDVIESWVSDGTAKTIELEAGEYIFHESAAPEGYVIATDIHFTIDEDGNITSDDVTVTGSDKNVIAMVDDYDVVKTEPTPVKLSKTDIGGKELPGATVELQAKDGTVIEKWVSGETAKTVELEEGAYIFHEVAAPEGYKIATDIAFTVDKDGNVTSKDVTVTGSDKNVIVMVDDFDVTTYNEPEPTPVKFSKTDVAGKELAGATVEVQKSNGKVVKSWVSDGTTKTIDLDVGEYIFHEVAAPEGYKIATDITFSVDKDGNVTSEDVTVTGDNKNIIVMVDDYQPVINEEPEPTNVYFSKTNVAGVELDGAKIELKSGDGTVIDTWTSNGSAKKFELEAGDYIFHEVAAPEGYKIATDITFTVDKDGNVTSKDVTVKGDDKNIIVMVDDYDIPDTPVPTDNPEPNEAPVQFSKTDIDGNELPGATIEVQKENGDVVEKWVSDGTAKTINLEEGEYIFHEVAAPEGYVIATDISFSVDKDGNVTSKDVTVKGDDKNIITMVDDFAKPDEPTTLDETPDTPEDTPEDTPQDTPQTQKVTKTVKTVKTSEVQTGDSNVMYIAGIAALLALIGAAAAFAVRRKENN